MNLWVKEKNKYVETSCCYTLLKNKQIFMITLGRGSIDTKDFRNLQKVERRLK